MKQEPTAWINKERDVITFDNLFPEMTPLYEKREWVGLTDEQIDRLWSQSLADTEGETWLPLREFARAIEAAHGIKENT